MMGQILKFFKFKTKSYGFIQSDKNTFYFNLHDCNDYEGYKTGDNVSFELKGEHAVNVSKIIH